eukprot:NP_001021868.4 Uncharacterized protein CELE_ZK39.9 [Caenorhabditis elegans]
MFKVLSVTVLVIGISYTVASSSSESCEDSREGDRVGRENGGCSPGWRRFNRPSGGWCVRVFAGILTQAEAEIKCKSHGATLSGLQNMEEARNISDMGLPVLNRASGSLWIGAKRMPV